MEPLPAGLPDLHVSRTRNPYGPRPGEAPAYFSGRRPHLTAAQQRFELLQATGRSPAAVVFMGPRGMGKTVLMTEIRTMSANHDLIPVWVTATPQGELTQAIVAGLKRAIETRFESVVDELLAKIDTLSFTVGLPGMNVSVDTKPGLRAAQPFSVALSDLAIELRRSRPRSGVVIFIDELQAAAKSDLEVLVPCLQEYTNATEPVPVLFVGAGLTSLPRVLASSGAGFAERFDYQWLEPLDAIGTGLAFRAGLAADFEWLPGSLELATAAARGHPHMIQLIGYEAWETSDASISMKAGFRVDDIKIAIEQTKKRVRQVFISRWTATTPVQREVLAALAHSPTLMGRANLAAALETPMPQIEEAVQELYDSGWLEAVGLEDLRIAYLGLDEFIRARSPLPSGAPAERSAAPE